MREITILRTFDRLCSNEKRRNRCDLIEVFKMFYGYSERDIRVLVTLDGNDKGLRGHSKKICKPRFKTDMRKSFFLKSSHWQTEQFGPGYCWCTQPELFLAVVGYTLFAPVQFITFLQEWRAHCDMWLAYCFSAGFWYTVHGYTRRCVFCQLHHNDPLAPVSIFLDCG